MGVPEGRRQARLSPTGAPVRGHCRAAVGPLCLAAISDLPGRKTYCTAHTYANLVYHVVFSTKNRLPLIRDGLRERLYEYVGGIVRGEGGSLMEVEGVPDHVHLLVRSKTDIAVATLVKKIKGQSSKWANDLPGRQESFYWQEGYGAFSVSASVVPKVQRATSVARRSTIPGSPSRTSSSLCSNGIAFPTTNAICWIETG